MTLSEGAVRAVILIGWNVMHVRESCYTKTHKGYHFQTPDIL